MSSMICLFVLLCLVCTNNCDVEKDEKYRSGRDRYEIIKNEAKMPKYGSCWRNAMTQLEGGCKQLTDDIQHRLALAFANCFLEKTRRTTYPCNNYEDFGECTKDMTPEAYSTYTEFFTHTQNMCYFLQSQIWQDHTENTIDKLADTSADVAKQMEDSSKLQNEVIAKQNISLRNQEIFLQRGSELKKTLEDSTVGVHQMLKEFKHSTSEQRALIFEVFERVNVLQSLVMGEFTGFYSLIFYCISVIISYLLTSTPRTSGARFWIFVIMTINIIVERLLVFLGVDKQIDVDGNLLDEGAVIYGRLWMCRKGFTSLAIVTWMLSAYRFKDYKRINNQLLVEIRKQNSDLKHLLQETASGKLSLGSENDFQAHPGLSSLSQHLLNHKIAETETIHSITDKNYTVEQKTGSFGSSTGYGTDTDYSDDTDDSEASDRTFLPTEEVSDTESDASFWTSRTEPYSRASTPSLLEELDDIRNSTPLREMTPFEDSFNSSRMSDISMSTRTSPRTRGRPRGPIRRSVPITVFPRYNLRSRKGKILPKENPVIQTESAEDFTKLVKHLNDVSSRNRVKIETAVGRVNSHKFFSSDED